MIATVMLVTPLYWQLVGDNFFKLLKFFEVDDNFRKSSVDDILKAINKT